MLAAIRHVWKNPYIKVLSLLIASMLAFFFLRATTEIWLSLLSALLLAYLFEPFVRRMSQWGLPRGLSVAIILLLIFAVLMLASIIFSLIITELLQLLGEIAPMLDIYQRYPERLNIPIPDSIRTLFSSSAVSLQSILSTAGSSLSAWLENRSSDIFLGVANFFGVVLQVILVPIMTGYFLYDYGAINRNILRFFPHRHRETAVAISKNLDTVVGSYFRMQILISLGVGVVTWIFLLLLGIPSALGLGFLAALGNFIPLFGPLIAAVPAVLMAGGSGPLKMLLVGILFLAINQIDGNIIKPLVFSQSNKLHPLMIIVAILIGLKLAGVWGAILAIPIAALIKLIIEAFYFGGEWYARDYSSPSQVILGAKDEKAPTP